MLLLLSGVIATAVMSGRGIWICVNAVLGKVLLFIYIADLGVCSVLRVGSKSIHDWCEREDPRSFDQYCSCRRRTVNRFMLGSFSMLSVVSRPLGKLYCSIVSFLSLLYRKGSVIENMLWMARF